MPKRLAIIQGHPDPAGSRFCLPRAGRCVRTRGGIRRSRGRPDRHSKNRISAAANPAGVRERFAAGDTRTGTRRAHGGSARTHRFSAVARHDAGPAQSLYRTGDATRCSARISQGGIPSSAARGALGPPRRHDGYAGNDLSLVFPRPRSTRVGAECAQIFRHEAGPRNAIGNGAVSGRRPASPMVGSNEGSGTPAYLSARLSRPTLSGMSGINREHAAVRYPAEATASKSRNPLTWSIRLRTFPNL